MLRKYPIGKIRAKHLYSFKEITILFSVTLGTVQSWTKRGLKVLCTTTRPFYVLGQNLIDFLKKESNKRKFTLGPGEMFCTKCRKPRKSKKEKLQVEITNKDFGKNAKQAFIWGECVICNQRIRLFMTDKKILEMIKNKKFFTEY